MSSDDEDQFEYSDDGEVFDEEQDVKAVYDHDRETDMRAIAWMTDLRPVAQVLRKTVEETSELFYAFREMSGYFKKGIDCSTRAKEVFKSHLVQVALYLFGEYDETVCNHLTLLLGDIMDLSADDGVALYDPFLPVLFLVAYLYPSSQVQQLQAKRLITRLILRISPIRCDNRALNWINCCFGLMDSYDDPADREVLASFEALLIKLVDWRPGAIQVELLLQGFAHVEIRTQSKYDCGNSFPHPKAKAVERDAPYRSFVIETYLRHGPSLDSSAKHPWWFHPQLARDSNHVLTNFVFPNSPNGRSLALFRRLTAISRAFGTLMLESPESLRVLGEMMWEAMDKEDKFQECLNFAHAFRWWSKSSPILASTLYDLAYKHELVAFEKIDEEIILVRLRTEGLGPYYRFRKHTFLEVARNKCSHATFLVNWFHQDRSFVQVLLRLAFSTERHGDYRCRIAQVYVWAMALGLLSVEECHCARLIVEMLVRANPDQTTIALDALNNMDQGNLSRSMRDFGWRMEVARDREEIAIQLRLDALVVLGKDSWLGELTTMEIAAAFEQYFDHIGPVIDQQKLATMGEAARKLFIIGIQDAVPFVFEKLVHDGNTDLATGLKHMLSLECCYRLSAPQVGTVSLCYAVLRGLSPWLKSVLRRVSWYRALNSGGISFSMPSAQTLVQQIRPSNAYEVKLLELVGEMPCVELAIIIGMEFTDQSLLGDADEFLSSVKGVLHLAAFTKDDSLVVDNSFRQLIALQSVLNSSASLLTTLNQSILSWVWEMSPSFALATPIAFLGKVEHLLVRETPQKNLFRGIIFALGSGFCDRMCTTIVSGDVSLRWLYGFLCYDRPTGLSDLASLTWDQFKATMITRHQHTKIVLALLSAKLRVSSTLHPFLNRLTEAIRVKLVPFLG